MATRLSATSHRKVQNFRRHVFTCFTASWQRRLLSLFLSELQISHINSVTLLFYTSFPSLSWATWLSPYAPLTATSTSTYKWYTPPGYMLCLIVPSVVLVLKIILLLPCVDRASTHIRQGWERKTSGNECKQGLQPVNGHSFWWNILSLTYTIFQISTCMGKYCILTKSNVWM